MFWVFAYGPLIADGSEKPHGCVQRCFVDQATKLLSLISSEEHFNEALAEIIGKHFGDPEWEPE